jgi:hypothetical protein
MAQTLTATGDRPMPTIKTQPMFFVTFISAKGNTREWKPTDSIMFGLFTLAQTKRRAMQTAKQMIDASCGHEDWSFVIHEAVYGIIGDPNYHQYGYTKGKEVFRFD